MPPEEREGSRMTTYQLVPYLVSVRPRGYESDVRPLFDVDAQGTALIDVISKIFSSARGRTFVDPRDTSKALEIARLQRGDRALFVELQPGRAGVSSLVRKQDGTSFEREVRDTEFTPIRHVYFFPSGGSYALLFAERIGQSGALNYVHSTLERNVQQAVFGSKPNCQPSNDRAALGAVG